MSERITLSAEVPYTLAGKRLDQAVARMFPDYSRSRLAGWIESGELTVDGRTLRPRDKVYGGEKVSVDAEPVVEERWQPQAIGLDIVYEDEAILVLNKPAGLVVHPAAGNPDGTLLNALLHHCPELAQVPRAGIVHRLDKDTTGLMVVAKTLEAQTDLVAQLQERSMGREYEAVVTGVMTGGGTVDEPMARHPRNRLKMAVHPMGKEAITHYRVLARFRAHTHVRLKLETGRTHQIRVHMAHIHYPLVGDPLYAGRSRLPRGCSPELAEALRNFRRQALHARQLELLHPLSGDQLCWEVPLPEDFSHLLDVLARDAASLETW